MNDGGLYDCEVWKDIPRFKGDYQASDCGRVRSVDRYITYSNGRTRLQKGKVLKPKIDKDGYKNYTLFLDKEPKFLRGNRIVAMTFQKESYSEDLVVDHIDEDKLNDCAWNLQCITQKENTIKYFSDRGGNLSSLSFFDWQYIGYLFSEGVSYKGIVYNMGLKEKDTHYLWEVLKGRKLSSVTGFTEDTFKKRKKDNKLSDEVVREILEKRLLLNMTVSGLAAHYGISESMVSRYCSGKRRPEILTEFLKTTGGLK